MHKPQRFHCGLAHEEYDGPYVLYTDAIQLIQESFVRGADWMGDRTKGGMSNIDHRAAEGAAIKLKWDLDVFPYKTRMEE